MKQAVRILYSTFIPVALLLSFSAKAWQPDTTLIRKVKEQYKDQHCVILNQQTTVTIKVIEGELVATSTTESDKLYLTEHAAKSMNYDATYRSYFATLYRHDVHASAWVPDGKGWFKESEDFGLASGTSDELFYDDSRTIAVVFGSLTKGSVTHFKVKHHIPELNILPDYFPQESIPVLKSSFTIVAPSFVKFAFSKNGAHLEWIKERTSKENGNNVYTFTAENLPALKELSGVPSQLYYMPHIIPYITSFRLPGEKKDSVMLADDDNLYRFQYKYIAGINVKKDTMLVNLVKKITAGDKTQLQKAQHIYTWVQQNLNYIAFEAGLAGWIPREADTVCKRKYGDCKDMSSLLVAMNRIAGNEAYFTWIGTSHKPYRFEELPSPIVSNHMICALKLDGKWVFVDGTHSNLPFGENRDDIQGKQAMIAIDAKHYQIVNIPVEPAEKTVIVDSTYLTLGQYNKRDVSGAVKKYLSGFPAWRNGIYFERMKKDEQAEMVRNLTERGSARYVQDDFKTSASDTGAKKVTISSTFHIDNYGQQAGNQYIINMNLTRRHYYIDTTDRTIPYYFSYKNITREVVTLEIPKGFKVKYLPKPARIGENGLWSCNISYKVAGNRIVLTKDYRLDTISVPVDRFAVNNRLAESLENQYKESVVLTGK